MNELIDNRYQIIDKLGQGTMGEVYKVRDTGKYPPTNKARESLWDRTSSTSEHTTFTKVRKNGHAAKSKTSVIGLDTTIQESKIYLD